MHRISVITPSYKQLDWLKLCAESVADQAGVEVEHLIQDAGTGSELEEWALGRANLKLKMEPDAGMYDAINRGLKRATGEICAYLNCDEQYLPGTLRTVADFFETHPGIDVLFADAILIDPAGNPLSYRRMILPTALHTRLVHLGTLSASTFFRRSIVERNLLFDPQWKAIGDAVWVDRLIAGKIPMAVLRQPLSIFTFTGVNLGAQGQSHSEVDKWRRSSKSPPCFLRCPTIALHRLKKFLAGAYSPKSFTSRHFTLDSPTERKPFNLSGTRFAWPSTNAVQAGMEIQARLPVQAEVPDQAGPPKIAAVFSTFNRSSDALACLSHLAEQTPRLHKIVVADNASVDGTADRIREQFGASLPVEVLSLPENLGNPAGIQLAMRRALDAGADWIWILDDDSWPRPDALKNLIQYGLNKQTVYSGLVIDPKRNDLAWPCPVVRCNQPRLAMSVRDLPKEEIFEIKGAWLGALIPAGIVREVGEVNPALFIRGEDEEYPARIRRHGFKFLCVASSVLCHPAPTRLLRFKVLGKNYFYEAHLPLWKSYYAVRNQIYVRKTFSQTALGGLLKGLASMVLNLLFCLAVDDNKWGRLRIQLKAACHGFTGKLGKLVPPGT